MNGKEWRKSTKEHSLRLAKDVAEDWYLELCAKKRYGELHSGITILHTSKQFAKEYEAITQGRRSPKWVKGHKDRLRLHLLPYFGSMPVTAITAGTAQEYRVRRMTKPEDWDDEKKPWKPPARNTIHNEIVTLNMVLKTAQRHGWLEHLPNLSDPYTAPMIRRVTMGSLPLIGQSAGKGYVWGGHLQRCVCEETGDIYYVPVLYIIEEAKAPNNAPVVK